MYQNGHGVEQDFNEAMKWYRLAAEQGLPIAQSNLGAMFATGRGVSKDDVKAYMWFNVAASNGQPEGVNNRDFIEKNMTPAQIVEAQKLARECVAKNYKGC